MNDKSNLDRESIGHRIGQVRRSAGLSTTAFAQSLQVPTMLAEIAEHGIKGADDAALDGIELSAKELRRLLEKISDIYRIPADWLLYGKGSAPKLAKNFPPINEELVLYLPVTISEQYLADELDKALLFVNTDRCLSRERLSMHRESLQSIVTKYILYKQHAVRIGNISCAQRARGRMLEAIGNVL